MINRRLLVGAGLASIAAVPVVAANDRAGRNAALIRRYKSVRVNQINIERVANGRIAEHWRV
jgi:hypothetical protein